ncbi:glucose-1-phosphate thymidylyltransferase [Bacteroidetes bacterium UKL13-3]|jgi:glucose-1-phosphate thymidylyltransferase|nr:glucose-1-phosphate thymidylyltransferase [Bacteroidetes bacterium UKL13-3]HCP92743.1 glucose-1-phosphate thymidylyltransferase [Bacteroidota bacterium]
MKAIIPVAGIGTRLRPHTHTQPKALIPIAGKPILAHIIDALIEAGIHDFVFVIGYMGDKIENYITSTYPNVKTSFVIQTTGKGTGHAIWLGKDEIKDEELLIVLGDTIADVNLKNLLATETTTLCVKKVDDPRLFGVAELRSDGSIKRLIEKPSIPKSNLALVGIYRIKETAMLLDAIEFNLNNKITNQNEYHLTDALQRMIDEGVIMKIVDVDNWFDCGKKEILLDTNATLLKRLNYDTTKYKFENTIIIPPVFIGENCTINNSIIGPNVSIGDNAILKYAITKDSIIGPYAQIEYAILEHSLIGNDAVLIGMKQSLNIGDSTEINFG